MRVGFQPLLTKNKQCHFLITTIWIRLFSINTFSNSLKVVTIWLHWYIERANMDVTFMIWGVWSAVDDKWWLKYFMKIIRWELNSTVSGQSIYLIHNKICKINMWIKILVLCLWYVTFWLSKTGLKYLHGFCYFLLFVFLPCWVVGFWIFKWHKTDKNITWPSAVK
jgi:hypothetical protein